MKRFISNRMEQCLYERNNRMLDFGKRNRCVRHFVCKVVNKINILNISKCDWNINKMNPHPYEQIKKNTKKL